jgi:hypothetical protein
MPITATNNGTTREPIPAGNYLARCYQMIEIGHIEENIMGAVKTLQKVRIGWELPDETRVFDPAKGEQPLVISKEYTLSMNEKSNLRKDLKSWRGKDFTEEEARSFDITKLIGVPCMLNIIHKPAKSNPGKLYEEISGITPLPKSVKCPPQVNKTMILSYDNFDHGLFDTLPDFIKNKIKSSEEYQAMTQPGTRDMSRIPEASEVNEPIDDLPF